MSLSKDADNFLRCSDFFSGLPEECLQTLLKSGALKTYSKNQSLFFQGDTAQKFFIIISGCIKIHSQTEDGQEAVMALLTAGKTVGEASIFDESMYPFSAAAAETAEIFEIRASLLKEQAKTHHSLTQKIMGIMSEEILDMQKEKEHSTLMSSEQRVGCLLLQLSGKMIGKGGTFTLPYDKSLAAANLGMQPETFSRGLKGLIPYGVHAKGSEVTIDSFEKLSNHCCVHCSSLEGACRGDKRSTL